MLELKNGLFTFVAARKSKDLLYQARSTSGAGLNCLDHFFSFGGESPHAKELHRHENGGQYVVEVMGDAARQSANTFQALCAEQLPLKFFLLGDVGVDREDRLRCAGVV